MGSAKRRDLTGLALVEVVLLALNRATPVRLSNLVGTSVSLFNLSRPPPPLLARICTLDSRDSNFFSISSSLYLLHEISLDFLICRRKIKISGQIRKEDAKNWRKDKNLWIDAKSNILETESKEFLLAWIRSFVAKCKIVGEGRRNDRR